MNPVGNAPRASKTAPESEKQPPSPTKPSSSNIAPDNESSPQNVVFSPSPIPPPALNESPQHVDIEVHEIIEQPESRKLRTRKQVVVDNTSKEEPTITNPFSILQHPNDLEDSLIPPTFLHQAGSHSKSPKIGSDTNRAFDMEEFGQMVSDSGLIDIGFEGDIMHTWSLGLPTRLNGLLNLHCKLMRVKVKLKWWNKNVFGNIFDNLQKAHDKVSTAEKAYDSSPSLDLLSTLNLAKGELTLATRN
ncbi:hypothetical protein DH2020_015407 [Rehmannia glutinosa]|uniref:Uncharacterized protein n=1 Tax=Rehmannia glutinosa TaxID=99300 RepID=A0ABR0WWA0_REHGL